MPDDRLTQLSLFDTAERASPIRGVHHPDHLRALAERLPSRLYMGTSSWSFPGWRGLVYDRNWSQAALARRGLAAYASHPLLRSVGVDRTYYKPMSADKLTSLGDAVPEKFRFIVKAHELVTRPRLRPSTSGAKPVRNECYLQPEYVIEQVIGPCKKGLGKKAAVMVFQFPPQTTEALGGRIGFVDRLHRFLGALPRDLLYAVELRNPDLLDERYVQALTDSGACHCFNVHPNMPPIETQESLTRGAHFPALVIRWMLRRDQTYEKARKAFAPFDRLAAEDSNSRRHIAKMCLDATSEGNPAYVIVNNKAEGSAPLSIFRLAESLALSL